MSATTTRVIIARHRHIDISATPPAPIPDGWPADLWEAVTTGQMTPRAARALRAERAARAAEDAGPLVCAECGTTTAAIYIATTLDTSDPKHTRTELCAACDDALRTAEPSTPGEP
ncbi:hypothetical protein F6W69_19020 [Microbacterium oxydans]|nr:hypothetical protein [Microbacterium oxydans]KAB1888843.1 hypothetical protein F6W69_19020 [Microbacterium oxydans]GED40666.1 hypothetical protein MOX01_38080 [Microbacterium oxydans]